ncbi:hypothetical protein CMI47_02865 [Candidatus Pacearchaeota archaeon]|nr:hypothetical protein [Candidatus Pacearchaeota archaeon]|tara:strand:+ start:2421 stop:2783 length:363 start_codon:yes stop_codon:yes gene_type:complete
MNLSDLTQGGRLTDTIGTGFSLIIKLEGRPVARVTGIEPPYVWEGLLGTSVEDLRGSIATAVQAALGTAIDDADDWMAACLADGAKDAEEATLWVAAALSHQCERFADEGICSLCERQLS